MGEHKDTQISNLKIENNRLSGLVDQYEEREKIYSKFHVGYALLLLLTSFFAVWGVLT
jgi:hypothetical protein